MILFAIGYTIDHRLIHYNIVMQISNNKFYLPWRTFCLSLISLEKFEGGNNSWGWLVTL